MAFPAESWQALHNISGGFLSRQAWGTGNFDIIETFKFLGIHKDCQPFLVSEDTDIYHDTPNIEDDIDKFIKDAHGIMPHSNDWRLVEENNWNKVEELFETETLKNINSKYDRIRE